MAKDPVCKMPVEEQAATLMSEHDGTRYYFCSRGCKETFDKDPGAFCGDTDILGRARKTT